jgi:hypothetical protein
VAASATPANLAPIPQPPTSAPAPAVLQSLPTATVAPGGTTPQQPVSGSPTVQVTVGGHTYEMPAVAPSIDAASNAVYQQVFGEQSPDWAAFNSAVVTFVASNPSVAEADRFLEKFTAALIKLLEELRYEVADDLWEHVITAVTDAEAATGTLIHKGTGYYFWAANSLTRGDLDRGLLLMHEAHGEDIRTYGLARPNTPAAKVVTLDNSGTHPLASWVDEQTRGIQAALLASGSALGIADLRARLFDVTDSSNVFLFVQAHASLLHLARIPSTHRDSDFVGRLALGHLFHLAVVVERITSDRSGVVGLFGDQAKALSKAIGGKLHQPIPGMSGKQHAWDINDQQHTNADKTLRTLLAGTASYGGTPVLSVDVPLCVAYVLRNVAGHQSGAPPVVAEQFDALRIQLVGAVAACTQAYY